MSDIQFEKSKDPSAKQELNVLALVRGKERYVYVYDDGSVEDIVEQIRIQAADVSVSLTWYDAAKLAEFVRKLHQSPHETP